MRNILITGATGFIGKHLVRKLLKEDFNLTIFSRRTSNLEPLKGLNVRIIYGDLRKAESLKGICQGIDMIVHLASQVDRPGVSKEIYEEINYYGTLNLVKEAIVSEVKKFIFISSVAAIGIRNIGRVIEKTSCFPNIEYGESKRRIEKELLFLHRTYKFPVVILRPPTVFGEGEKYNFLTLTRQIKNGPYFLIGKGNNLVDFCYVENLTEAIFLAIKNGKPGEIYLIADKRPYTMREVSETIAEVVGKKIPSFTIPKWFAYLAGYILEFLGKIFHFQPPLYPRRVKTLTSNFYFDIEKARSELGYQPKEDFKGNVRKTVKWYKENNLI